MNLNELHPFRLKDAIKFHNELNPKLWWGSSLQPRVRKALLKIAGDFVEYLGIDKLEIKDITISGSNAAYTYTPHSDIDLHIVVDMNNLNPDSVYQELFKSKRDLYNTGRKITVHGISVECYVQDSAQEHVTLGEYSVQDGKWIKYPTKTRAHLDHRETRLKYEKLRGIVERAIKTRDSTLIGNLLKKIAQYRSAGLARGGEFGPENLAYKALRAQGTIDKLYKLRDRLRGRELSIENMYVGESRILDKPTPTVKQIASKHSVEPSEVERQLKRGIKVEREHTNSDATAREIALDHLSERPDYYKKLSSVGLEETNESVMYSGNRQQDSKTITVYFVREKRNGKWVRIAKYRYPLTAQRAIYDLEDAYAEKNVQLPQFDIERVDNYPDTMYEASGYIPSPRERNDPRFKTALSVDVTPYSIQDNARRLGSKIARDGRPPLLRK